jgi:hypothetical protein
VSGGDGMGSSTQVPIASCAWVPAATSYRARHLMPPFPKVPAPVVPTQYGKPPGKAVTSSRASRAEGEPEWDDRW